jgi:hypothetical protein
MRVFSVLDTGKRTEIGVTVIVVGIIVAVISGLGLLSDLSTAQQALS